MKNNEPDWLCIVLGERKQRRKLYLCYFSWNTFVLSQTNFHFSWCEWSFSSLQSILLCLWGNCYTINTPTLVRHVLQSNEYLNPFPFTFYYLFPFPFGYRLCVITYVDTATFGLVTASSGFGSRWRGVRRGGCARRAVITAPDAAGIWTGFLRSGVTGL